MRIGEVEEVVEVWEYKWRETGESEWRGNKEVGEVRRNKRL